MNRTVLFGTLALLLAAVPALPSAAAAEPCVKDDCVLVYRGDDWACAAMRIDWEVYGACAEASPACVVYGSDRVNDEICAPLARPAAGPTCVGVAPELGGTMTCVGNGCVSHQGGVFDEEVCVLQATGGPGLPENPIIRQENGRTCVAVAPEYGGTMTCLAEGCVSHHGGVVREQVCAAEFLP